MIVICLVLVVAPSTDLRKQLSDRFVSEHDLAVVSAVAGKPEEGLKVMRMTTRAKSWSNLEEFDVVIALPNTISPRYYPNNLPPANLFDMVIIDEAHHASAATWFEILHHFKDAYSLLLTATPIRRDGKRIKKKSCRGQNDDNQSPRAPCHYFFSYHIAKLSG